MCGYCTENLSLLAAAGSLVPDAQTSGVEARMAMQELSRLADAFASGVAGSQTGEDFARIFLARLLDVLFHGGYDSPEYQALLSQPDFERLIDLGCNPNLRRAYSIWESPLDTCGYEWVLDRATYLSPHGFINAVRMARNGSHLLQQYARWWLDGHGLTWLDHDHKVPEHATGVDRLADHRRLDRSFLALWVAIVVSSKNPNTVIALRPIALTQPAGIPNFEALDLWLQRRAALAVYDLEGIAPFVGAVGGVRPEIFQYLKLKGRITASERDVFINRLSERKWPM